MLTKVKNSENAVAPVIGFMLILAILFLAAAQYQMNVVPAQERGEEIDHFTEVTGDISGLRSSIIQTSSTGQLQTQEMDLGVNYNVLGLTQPPQSGSLAYINTSNITIRNAQNNKEASNYWRGDVNRTYRTGIIQYRIDYNLVQSHADLYLEHGFMYRDTERGSDEVINMIPESEQSIINERSITLYTIRSELNTQQYNPVTVETKPISAPMNSVAITNVQNGDPIKLEIPTRLSVQNWTRILEDELESENDDGFVTDINEGVENNTIELVLKENETYNLRMARVDMNTQIQQTANAITEPQYIAVNTQSANVREGGSISLDAEVRDKFNNGVIGIPVDVEAQDAGRICIGDFAGTSSTTKSTNCDNQGDYRQPGEDISSADGSVSYIYNAPELGNNRDITFTYRIDE